MKQIATMLVIVISLAMLVIPASGETVTTNYTEYINNTVVLTPYDSLYATEAMTCYRSEDLEYPQEYYTLENTADGYARDFDQNHWATIQERTGFATMAVFKELRRQTILLEKQNELLAEQNYLLRKMVKEDSS